MSKIEGKVDRILRVTAGCVVLSQAFIGLQTPFAYIGLVFIVTGLVGFCPLYKVFGFNTCPLKNS